MEAMHKVSKNTRRALAYDILKHCPPGSGCSFSSYVHWVLEPAAKRYIDEGESETINTPFGVYDMEDVFNRAMFVANEMEQKGIACFDQIPLVAA